MGTSSEKQVDLVGVSRKKFVVFYKSEVPSKYLLISILNKKIEVRLLPINILEKLQCKRPRDQGATRCHQTPESVGILHKVLPQSFVNIPSCREGTLIHVLEFDAGSGQRDYLCYFEMMDDRLLDTSDPEQVEQGCLLWFRRLYLKACNISRHDL